MSPLRLLFVLPLVLLPLVSLPATAETRASTPTKADPGIGPQLDQLGYSYKIDEDGDYRMVLKLDGGERTQLVYVRSPVETLGNARIREIWSPAYRAGNGTFPGPVANRLLAASNALKLGSWVKQGPHAVLVIKIDAAAGASILQEAIDAAASSADEMEKELAEDPDADEF